MPLPRVPTTLLAGLLCLLLGPAARTEEPKARRPEARPAPGKFLRLQRDDQGAPTRLETAVVRYVPAQGQGGLAVDLVSVVHVGDRAYYEQLNKLFDDYEVVLYELVAPQGTRIPRGGKRSDNPVAMLQSMMKSVLALESQTELIDYTRKNFVHADLSPEQMAEAMRARGETGFTLFLSIAADLMRQQNLLEQAQQKKPARAEPDLDLFSLLVDPEAPQKLKRLLAEQFDSMEALSGGLGNTLNTILVTDRNKAALKVFQTELARGRKKIAIFYGAAHMPDFEKRLQEEFGLRRDSERWLVAWNLKPQKKGFDILDVLKVLEP